MMSFDLVSIFLFVSFLFLLKKWMNSKNQVKRLPPGPWKLPIRGSTLHMVGGLPHRVLRDLAKKYGPLMHLQLGEVSVVVVTSPEIAKEVLKTHDLAFASRPKLLAAEIVLYDSSDVAFAPYGDYWRQMRKICVLEVLSTKNVRSFSSIRRDEVFRLVEFFRSSSGKPVNYTKRISLFMSFIICRSAFGTVFKEQDEFIQVMKNVTALLEGFDVADIFPSLKFLHVVTGMRAKAMNLHHKVDAIVDNVINEHKENLATGKFSGQLGGEDLIDVLLRLMKDGGFQFPITNDNIKAIIYDMFAAGTETTSTTIDWAMVEMIRNASVFAKAQAEVREVFSRKETFDENDVEKLKYLKLVIKETLRLHPPLPLMLPKECREETNINGYTIPLKSKVMVNVWAIGRDPKYWDDAESFKPERYEQSSVDFVGNNFEYLPFGSGRRICLGISFGIVNIYLPLAQLLYYFDWKLPTGINPSDLDMTESDGASCARKSNLYLVASPYQPSQE
ncbi:premnaspirodiene oxygenase-like [Nicotiana tabacum]|uniref:Premnaspirodiene oxygenase-like n=1 Tax=Nicotiana tabacum TaxID=4097 RepID=A0A1S3YBJ0_TOBAC|nr:PREDICTED: premnaspirodiene oxygenase-like isoform X1 [Nicotiana tabacum]